MVELKWDKNKKLIEGYTRQLPRYAECEETTNCFFVVVEVSQNGKNLENLQKVYYAQKEQGIKQPELFIIDGKIKPSASKLKRKSPPKEYLLFRRGIYIMKISNESLLQNYFSLIFPCYLW